MGLCVVCNRVLQCVHGEGMKLLGVLRCADSWQLHLTHCLCTLKAKAECLLGLNSSVSLESMSQAFSNVHLDKAE